MSADPVAQAVERLTKDITDPGSVDEHGIAAVYVSDLRLLLADHAAKTAALKTIRDWVAAEPTVPGSVLRFVEKVSVSALVTPTTKEK